MRCRDYFGNFCAGYNEDAGPILWRLSKVHEAIEEPFSDNVLMFLTHMPAAVAPFVPTRFDLNSAQAMTG